MHGMKHGKMYDIMHGKIHGTMQGIMSVPVTTMKVQHA
jgi:hypothetical protein